MDRLWIYCTLCVILIVVFSRGVDSRGRRGKPICGSGWVSMHRACYKFDRRKLSWDAAQAACREDDGALVSISSNSEKKQIKNELKNQIQNIGEEHWWVGLRWNMKTRRFAWADQGPFSRRITPWAPGEPNNGRGKRVEHCVEFKYDGRLNDKGCETLRPFICEHHDITPRPTFKSTVPAVTSTSTTIATTMSTKSMTTMSSTTSPTTVTFTTTPIQTTPTSTRLTTSTPMSSTPVETTKKVSQAEDKTSTLKETKQETTTIRSTNDLPRTTISIVTTTSWDDRCYRLSSENSPVNSNGVLSSDILQRYDAGATSCPPAYAANMMWPATLAGTFAEIPCRSGKGNATWSCGSNPTCWRGEPDVAGCASPKFKKILKKVFEPSGEKASNEEQVNVTSVLVEVTATEQMSVEDVILTSQVIRRLGVQSEDEPKDKKTVTTIVENVVKVGSNVVSNNKSSTWDEMAPAEKVRSASNLMVAMESTTASMAAVINEPTVIKSEDENIDLELRVVDVTQIEDDVVYDDEASDNVFSIPIATLRSVSKGGLAKAVFMTHYKMADLLQEPPSDDDDEEGQPKTTIASSILSASLGTETLTHLPEPITFTMKHVKTFPDTATPKCSFWDIRNDPSFGSWSQEGCQLAGTNKTHTTCKCDHLTNFAILMDVEGVEMPVIHEKLLEFITLVGCIISLLCLAASWFTFMCFGSLQGERNSIHKNLVACLFVAELLFVTGINRTANKLACTLIAGFLHYFFLSTFMWMFMEGIHMIIMLVQVFDAAMSRLPMYYITGYGVPLLIVAVSAAFFYQGYGTEKHCWLSTEHYFIWSFAGPVALILLVNAVILTYAMVMVCRHSEYVINSKEKNTGGIRTWIQGALSMEVLLGLTWTFGYFFISKETIALAYVFTILNSLQGLFIFCFHCLLNKKVLKEYKRILHISKRRPGASTQSASLMRKQSQSYELSGKSGRDSNC